MTISSSGTVGTDPVDRAGRLLGVASVRGTSLGVDSYTLSAVTAPPTPNTTNATNSVAASDVTSAGNVSVSVSGTWTGSPAIYLEQSDDNGTTWFQLNAARSDTSTVESIGAITLPAGTARLWDAGAEGVTHIRVRMVTAPATGAVTVRISQGSLPFEPSVAVGPVDTRPVAPVTTSYALSAITAPPVPNTAPASNSVIVADVTRAGSFSFSLSGTFTGGPAVTWEASDDGGSTWYSFYATRIATSGMESGNSPSPGNPNMWVSSAAGLTHVRVRMTTAPATGSVMARITPSALPFQAAVTALLAYNSGNTIGVVRAVTTLYPQVDGAGNAQPILFAAFNVTAVTTAALLVAAPAAGRSIRVVGYQISVGAAMTVTLLGGTPPFPFPLPASGNVHYAGSVTGPAFQVATATALSFSTSAAGQAFGHIAYVIV